MPADIRSIDVQCNGCGSKGRGYVQVLPLDGISSELTWIAAPKNWFVTQCLVENAEHELGMLPGKTPAAFLICDVCGRLGRSQMGGDPAVQRDKGEN